MIKLAITYTLSSIKNRKKQPLLKVDRVKYRSHRVSERENVETNLIKLDISRISNSLDATDQKVLLDLKYFTGDVSDENESSDLNDGLSYDVDDLDIYYDDSAQTVGVTIDTLPKVFSRISRLKNKVSRLEKDS